MILMKKNRIRKLNYIKNYYFIYNSFLLKIFKVNYYIEKIIIIYYYI